MFRDLKEYQEIAKIYAEKVSKPENLEERRGGNIPPEQIKKNQEAFKNTLLYGNKEGKRPDISGSNKRALFSKRRTEIKNNTNKEPEYKPEKGVVFGQRTNEVGAMGGGKPSEGNFKKDFPDKEKKVEVSNLTKQGKERTPAQIAAAKRIASGKTIQQVKDENLQSIKNKAKLKNTDFQAMKKGDMSKDDFVKKYPNSNLAKKMKEGYELDERELQEKKVKPAPVPAPDMKYIMSHGMSDQTFANTANKVFSGKSETGKDGYSDQNKFTAELMRRQSNTGKDFSGIPLYKKKEESKPKADVKSSYEYDAYDLVLEYLLSSEQAATIEEANYVMTEMDAETIQGIVEEQKKKLDEGLPLIAKGAMIVGGSILAKKGLDKAKKSFDNYIDNERDKPGGGNTRPGADQVYFGDKKKK